MRRQLGLANYLKQERGAILIITAVGMMAFITFFSLVVDFGHIFVTKAELQNTADSAAMASIIEVLLGGEETAEQVALDFGQAHQVAGDPILVNPDDVVFGHYDLDLSQFEPNALPTNGVQVTARKAEGALSGPLPLFFARLFGKDFTDVNAVSLAVLDNRISGLTVTNQLLPYTMLQCSEWETPSGCDANGQFDVGTILDVFPGHYAPGNFGFLDLDGGSNGTPDLNEWIEEGYEGEPFIIPPGGSIEIEGNPGIHGASLLGSFTSLVGPPPQERFMPVHISVTGQGANTVYTVVAILAVRILDVQLTGPPANRHINVEIIPYTSSSLAVCDECAESSTLTKPRLAL